MKRDRLIAISRVTANRDMAAAIIFTIAASTLLIVFNLNERFFLVAARHEQWQLDEFPLVLLVAYAALAWFSLRRWKQSLQEAAARAQAEQQVTQLLADNQRLLRHALEVQEEEKRNLARELHDELAQYLHAARTESASLRLVSKELLVVERANSIEHLLTHIHLMARDVISRLRPPALDELGLSAALEQLASRQCETMHNLDCHLDIRREIDIANGNVAIYAYRIAQECLTNIMRHSAATCIDFTAALIMNETSFPDAATQLLLEISDNGRGYPTALVTGFGLAGIDERVKSLGGTLAMHSESGLGVHVRVTLPLS